MNSTRLALLTAGCAAAVALSPVASNAPTTLPSDPIGVYALLEEVKLLPDAEAPTRVEFVGAFAVAEGRFGDYHRAPRWGRMLLTAPADKLEACVVQWRDIASRAGSGKVVGFSSRYEQKDVRVVDVIDAETQPGVMAVGWAVQDIENANWGPARELRLLCRPLAPSGDGPAGRDQSARPATEVGFTARNCAFHDDELRYLFLIDRNGESFTSAPVVPGDGTTSWKTTLTLVPGETIRWGIQTLHPKNDRAPIAWTTFEVGPLPTKDR